MTRIPRCRRRSLRSRRDSDELSRLVQASLVWIPVWLLGILNGPQVAATYAAAARMAVAATAVIGALRFAVRSQIVLHYARSEYSAITRVFRGSVRQSPQSCLYVPLCFCICTPTELLCQFSAPETYTSTGAVLTILMFGVLAEAIGGVSDEILKISTGRAIVVVVSLARVNLRGNRWPTTAGSERRRGSGMGDRHRLCPAVPSPDSGT